jgi:RNA polymerase sigma-70 factor (ECF subfamily)
MDKAVQVSRSSEAADGISSCPEDVAGARSNEKLLGELVRLHLARVYRLLRQLGVPARDTDDATQQVFWVLSGRLNDIRPGSELAFLSATAVRIASRWRRTHRRRREDEDAEPLSQCAAVEPSPELQLERAQAEQLLLQVLETIPEKLREVFVLYEIEEMTLREISEALDVPQGTAASRLRLARQCFRRSIEALGLSFAPRRAQ